MVSAEVFRSRGNPAEDGYFTAIKQIRDDDDGAVKFSKNIKNREDIKSTIYGVSISSSIAVVSNRAKTKSLFPSRYVRHFLCVMWRT
jgi:hypothetical protein